CGGGASPCTAAGPPCARARVRRAKGRPVDRGAAPGADRGSGAQLNRGGGKGVGSEQGRRAGRRRRGAGRGAVAVGRAGCAASGRFDPQIIAAISESPRQAETGPAAQREHQRILAAYGGTYQDARVEGLIAKTVERLVAASERPDLHYRVTLLNSPSVNAF